MGYLLIAMALGYGIGLLQKGIHIHINKGNTPLVPKPNETPNYNEDFSHMLPPEMQDFFQKNNGQIK